MTVLRCRHLDYTPATIPIVRDLTEDTCLVSGGLVGTLYGARHVYSTPSAISVVQTALKCCDEVNDCLKVETDVFPGGISPVIKVHAMQNENCASAQHQFFDLVYCKTEPGSGTGSGDGDCRILECSDPPPIPPDGCTTCDLPGQGKWVGSLALVGGTLDFQLCCYLDGVMPTFRFIWSGCNEGCLEILAQCDDPLFIVFQFSVNDCCNCLDSIEDGAITLNLVANCRPVVSARHVYFTGGGIPVVATADGCAWSEELTCGCDPNCGLVLTITGDGECSCLDGAYTFPYTAESGGQFFWSISGIGECAQTGQATMICEVNLDDDGKPDGTVTLQMTVVCGADNTGTASLVTVCNMDILDVTFDIEMFGAAGTGTGGCGSCTFQWNEMAMSWSNISSNCTDSCLCVDELTIPPGTVDGEQVTLPCVAEEGSICCIGTISIRVMR